MVTALLGASCSLVAPFDLSHLPLGDADADADVETDGEPDSDGDAEADADPEAWSPLGGCTGAVAAERWIVVAKVAGALETYVTERDCARPERLCLGCYGASFSPSGELALVLEPARESWRLEDRIGIVDVAEGEGSEQWLEVLGANPVFIDDDTFVYVAAAEGVTEPCTEPDDRPERTVLRRHVVSTGEEAPLDCALPGAPLQRGWRGGFPVLAPGLDRIAFGHDLATRCGDNRLTVTVCEPASGACETVAETLPYRDDFPVGLLPDGTGFLFQSDLPRELLGLSAASWQGQVALVDLSFADDGRLGELVDGLVEGFWPSCGSARRLGPTCELHCLSSTEGTLWRLTLGGGDPELVTCSITGAEGPVRVMDVWQR